MDPKPLNRDTPKIVVEGRVRLERKEPITRIEFNEGVLAALKLTTNRYTTQGLNDLLVFLANPGQEGSTRYVDQVVVIENDQPNMVFAGDFGMELEKARSKDRQLRSLVPIGLGSAVANLGDVRNALHQGYTFYAGCGDTLENARPRQSIDAGYWLIWARSGDDITQIESVVLPAT